MDSSIQNRQEQGQHDALLGAMFEHSTIGIIMANKDGVIIKYNPFIAKIICYEIKELVVRKIETLKPSKYHIEHLEHRQSYPKTPSPSLIGASLGLLGQRKVVRSSQ